jgi:hypothetical protein
MRGIYFLIPGNFQTLGRPGAREQARSGFRRRGERNANAINSETSWALDKEFATLGGAFHRGDQAAIKKATAIQHRINELRCEKASALAAQKRTIQQQLHEQAEAEHAA